MKMTLIFIFLATVACSNFSAPQPQPDSTPPSEEIPSEETPGEENPDDGSPVTFQVLQEKIFAKSCHRCHSGPAPDEGIDLSTFEATLSSGIVVVGEPNSSKLYRALASGRMPPRGALPPDQIELVQTWIAQGAIK